MSNAYLRVPVLVAAISGAVLALAACGSGGAASGDGGAPAAPSSGGGAIASGKSVTVSENEFHVVLGTKTLTPGAYTFQVKNTGSITHALTVDGPGVKDKSTGDISPGASSTLTVTLKAGSYEVYCPVGNHKMEGMDETVKVA